MPGAALENSLRILARFDTKYKKVYVDFLAKYTNCGFKIKEGLQNIWFIRKYLKTVLLYVRQSLFLDLVKNKLNKLRKQLKITQKITTKLNFVMNIWRIIHSLRRAVG